MKGPSTLLAWLDIRPGERRNVMLAALGAFLVIAFVILARSLREALYLTVFDIKTLPHITAAVAVLSLPVVGGFTRLLTRVHPRTVLQRLTRLTVAGLLVLWPLATRHPVTLVVFFLWTALATLLLTSGFWMVTAEHFGLRGAKRLYGLISAGGTAGAMVSGLGLPLVTRQLELIWLFPVLVGLLGSFYLVVTLLPRPRRSSAAGGDAPFEAPASIRDSLRLIWHTPHLRTLAIIIFLSSTASILIDYQFKDLARTRFATPESLASFFGIFYGWTGVATFAIQLLGVARITAVMGIGPALATLPALLMLGSAGLLVVPGLLLATAVRATDNSLRKSILRPLLETFFLPVPGEVRRRTKTFIDSFVDSVATGFGSALVYLWVSVANVPSRFLPFVVLLLAGTLLLSSRRMDREYLKTIISRLGEWRAGAADLTPNPALHERNLLSAAFTRVDVQTLLSRSQRTRQEPTGPQGSSGASALPLPKPSAVVLPSSLADVRSVLRALQEMDERRELDGNHIRSLVQLLAIQSLHCQAGKMLVGLGKRALPELSRTLHEDPVHPAVTRRIPPILARIPGTEAEDVLLGALRGRRFEVRYLTAIELVRRRQRGHKSSRGAHAELVWRAIREEISREHPVWELQRQIQDVDLKDEALEPGRIVSRADLGLEHVFRMLTLVLEPEPVRAAYRGILNDDEHLRGFALEYLEHVLPADVKGLLWPFIGDASVQEQMRNARPLPDIAADLLSASVTLFADEKARAALTRMLQDRQS